MRRLFSVVRMLALAATVMVVPQGVWAQGKVQIASDDWCPFVCGDGRRLISGFLVDVADEALGAAGYRLESPLLPLNRAMVMAGTGAVDGVYAPVIDTRLVMTKPLVHSTACFYTQKDAKWTYKGPASLANVSISAIDDYGYDDGPFDVYVAEAKRTHSGKIDFRTGADAGEKNIKMLLARRFPVMIEHAAVMGYLLKLQAPEVADSVRSAGCLERGLPLVIGFSSRNPATPALIQAINSGVDRLQTSGRMKALEIKYGITH